MPHGDPWTPQEDAIIFKLSVSDAAHLLGRTYHSVNVRRYNLRHPQAKATTKAKWSKADASKLAEHYPIIKLLSDLEPMFDGRFTPGQIRTKARLMKLKRRYLGDEKGNIKGHGDLAEEVRMRCKEDGIPIYKLDRILKTGTYFSYNAHRRRTNLAAIAKAVVFFGGHLVIDWNDRAKSPIPGSSSQGGAPLPPQGPHRLN